MQGPPLSISDSGELSGKIKSEYSESKSAQTRTVVKYFIFLRLDVAAESREVSLRS